MKVYVASSWRNAKQPHIVALLRSAGHEVYDYKNPARGVKGFSWSDADPGLKNNGPRYFASKLDENEVALAGFRRDRDALNWCDVCVLVLPCGRSAHLEAGYACGQGKKVLFMLDEDGWEPELMYLLGSGFCITDQDLLVALRHIGSNDGRMTDTALGWKG
jgi:hypothetical protein